MKERFKSVLKYTKPRLWAKALALAAVALVIVFFKGWSAPEVQAMPDEYSIPRINVQTVDPQYGTFGLRFQNTDERVWDEEYEIYNMEFSTVEEANLYMQGLIASLPKLPSVAEVYSVHVSGQMLNGVLDVADIRYMIDLGSGFRDVFESYSFDTVVVLSQRHVGIDAYAEMQLSRSWEIKQVLIGDTPAVLTSMNRFAILREAEEHADEDEFNLMLEQIKQLEDAGFEQVIRMLYWMRGDLFYQLWTTSVNDAFDLDMLIAMAESMG